MASMLPACARTDLYYPSNRKEVIIDERGRVNRHHNRAVVLNGSDSLGATTIRITSNSLEFSNQGGIDNSTSTKEGHRTIRHGVTAGALAAVGVAGINAASSSASANQAATATSNAAARRPEPPPPRARAPRRFVCRDRRRRSCRQSRRRRSGAGSTIPSIIPSVVTPVVP